MLTRYMSEALKENIPEDIANMRHKYGMDSDVAPDGFDPDNWKKFHLIGQVVQLFQSWVETMQAVEPETVFEQLDEFESLVFTRDPTLHYPILHTEDGSFPFRLTDEGIKKVSEPAEVRASELLKQFMNLEFTRNQLETATVMTERAFNLLKYVTQDRTGVQSKYLRRVAGCYLRDMQVEGLIMSRVVIENALQDAIPRETLRQEGVLTRDGQIASLQRLVNVGKQTGLLDEQRYKFADEIIKGGNKAAHGASDLPELDVVVKKLSCVLQVISADR